MKPIKRYPTFLHRLKPAQILLLGFGFLIFVGAFLLMLPISSREGVWTNFLDSLFTATSAVCVTGLVVVDTSVHWNIFGQIIIILLIQIGGLGFMSVGMFVAVILGKKISLRERVLIKESLNQTELRGSVKLIKYVIKYTFSVELIGALILSSVMIPKFGVKKGVFFSLFHSVSAFCNAGFDLMGRTSGEYSSITMFYNNPVVVFTIAILIILGGIGFPVTMCIIKKKNFKNFDSHTKLVIVTTVILLILGTIFIYFGEAESSFKHMNGLEKFESSFFQSVTTRTAGFATVDLTKMRASTLLVMIILMFIGASPSSTGGGIKTTTLAILLLSVRAFLKNERDIKMYNRRLNMETFRKAFGILIISIITVIVGTYLLSITQDPKHFGMIECVFESSSAFATVGLSLGGSNNLNLFGKILVIALMYAGRVGMLSIVSTFIDTKNSKIRYPEEKVMVG